jgi:hypothetical protein
MAFPGTYDIKYYKGDTFEFFIYPKNSSGNTFDLTGFTEIEFTIAEKAGTIGAASAVSGETDVDGNNTYIKCIITPFVGEQLDATKPYVYDVQIKKPAGSGSSYPYIYTILRGNIAITEQVTLPPDEVAEIPANVTSLAITEPTANTIRIDWADTATGISAATSYKIYGKSTTTTPQVSTYTLITSVTAPTTIYETSSVFTIPLSSLEGNTFDIKVTAVNSAGESTGVEGSITTLAPPNTVTGLNAIEDPIHSGAIAASWTAPAAGPTPTHYIVYFKASGGEYDAGTEIPASITAFSTYGTPLQAFVVSGVEYTLKVTSKNAAGENTTTFATDTVTV